MEWQGMIILLLYVRGSIRFPQYLIPFARLGEPSRDDVKDPEMGKKLWSFMEEFVKEKMQ
jgi:hypothetical protein